MAKERWYIDEIYPNYDEEIKESKESKLIEKVATKLKDEKIINGIIDTYRGADWFAISEKNSTIKVIYMRGELAIELYQNGKFQGGKLEKANSLSDDDFSVNYVIDFIKNFLKVNKNEFSIKESLKESHKYNDSISLYDNLYNCNPKEMPSDYFLADLLDFAERYDRDYNKKIDELMDMDCGEWFDYVIEYSPKAK